MCKPSFDEVTKEELLDSIKALSEALEDAMDYIPYIIWRGNVTTYSYCKNTLLEHGSAAYSETYKDCPK